VIFLNGIDRSASWYYAYEASVDHSPFVRVAVAEVLIEFSINDVADILDSLLRDEVTYVVQSALQTIGAVKDDRFIFQVRGLSKSNNKFVKGMALRSLGSIGESSDLDILLTNLSDRHPKVRLGAAIGLYRLGDNRALIHIQKKLYEQLDTGKFDNATIRFLVKANKTCDGEGRDEQLLLRLIREAVTVRSDAAWCIGYLKVEAGRKALESGLQDSSQKLRSACLQAIKVMGVKESLAVIEPVTNIV